MPAVRTKATFAGISFSGFSRDGRYVTVPVNVLRKIAASGRASMFCNYAYTDDYFSDAQNDNGKGPVPLDRILGVLAFGKPYLSYLDTQDDTISLSPYQSCSYTISAV